MRYLILCVFVAASITCKAEAVSDFLAGELRAGCKLLNDDADHRAKHGKIEGLKSGQCAGFMQAWIDGVAFASDGYPFLPENEPITVGQVSRVFLLYIEKHPEKENQLAFNVVLDAILDAKLISPKRLLGIPKWKQEDSH